MKQVMRPNRTAPRKCPVAFRDATSQESPMIRSRLLALGLPAVLAACANPPAAPAVPDALKPSANEVLVSVLSARGVQIYECRARKDDPSAAEWTFVAPEAQLYDAQGRAIGKHYAGPHWEAADGSKVIGTVKARADAPQAGAIPWLLLTTRSVGGNGVFSGVTSIQRVATRGGAAPAEPCVGATLGKTARVDYTADYVMYAAR
jgi:hypothetical protein